MMAQNTLNVFFSNRTEVLFQELKQQLFATSHPLTKRLIIVPSAAMKSWLMLEMALDEEFGIAAGIEIKFLETAMSDLHSLMTPSIQKPAHEPTSLELALALETTISGLFTSFPHLSPADQKKWQALCHYLAPQSKQPFILTTKINKRMNALSISLAKLFNDYGKFGGEMLTDWKNEKNPNWQQLLWNEIDLFFNQWNYPYRKYLGKEFQTHLTPEDFQIHLFGLSYLPPLYHRFLENISHKLPVNYYLFSPCQKFWSDMISDKESHRLKNFWKSQKISFQQEEALDVFLRDNNPLLANFGRMGREMSQQIESTEIFSYEKYTLPFALTNFETYENLYTPDIDLEKTSHPFSLLEAIQTDITLLRTPEESNKITFEEKDTTIQIHQAPKSIREAEIIYNTILSIIEKHAYDETPITPRDVLVMAPDIANYAPLIQSVFESTESQLPIQIMDLQVPSENQFIQGFLHLLQLPKGRWNASSLLQLFTYPAFQQRHQLTSEEIQLFNLWIKKADIRWGKDFSHRNEILQRNHCENSLIGNAMSGTWEIGLGSLLEGLAFLSTDLEDNENSTVHNPLNLVESNQAENLGLFLKLLRSLHADLKPLTDHSLFHPQEWATYLQCLCDTYFASTYDHESTNGYRLLTDHLACFNSINEKLKKTTVPFSSIEKHLLNALNKLSTVYKESNLQAVRFCSLLPMRAVPAKVVILMGMSDTQFPRKDDDFSLNLLKNHPKADFYPNQVDFDRYLFLEALLSARRYFILSYVNQEAGESKEVPPSTLIKELLSYLDSAFVFPQTQKFSQFGVYQHPLCSFHKSYFSADSFCKSYSKHLYNCALTYYTNDKKPAPSFLPNFPLPLSTKSEQQQTVLTLTDLTSFIKHPLKTYFNKTLAIYLNKEEERKINDEDELLLSDLHSSILSKEGVFTTLPSLINKAEQRGQLPSGPFKPLAIERITKNIEAYISHLSYHDLTPSEIFSIEFNDRYHENTLCHNCWQLPSLVLSVPNFGEIRLIGKIEYASAKGLISFNDDDIKKAIEIWPSFLAFCCLIDRDKLPIEKNVFFVKGQKSKSENFNRPEKLLADLIAYYFKTKHSISPLQPEWIVPIINGLSTDLQKEFQEEPSDFKPLYNEYLKWLKRNSPHTDFHTAVKEWQTTAKELFFEMGMAWYPKKIISEEGSKHANL